jgi:drug/metabolite transporter (DMT)-like permease
VFAVHLLIQAWGLEHTTAVHTGWIIGAMPAAIAVGAWLVFGQRLSAVGWVGVGLASLGVATVVWAHPPGLASARFGDLLQVVSIGTWTVYTLVAVRPVARWGALAVTTASMALAAVVSVPVAVALGRGPWMPGDVRTWSAVLFLGIVAGAVAQALWLRALGVLGAARTAAWLYLEPIVTVAVARALLSEPVGWRAVVGGLVVLIGVAVVQGARNAVPAPAAGQPVSRR